MSQVVQNCNFSGKERKTCQKCHRVYPFFKTECNYCQYKFPKTRLGASTSIQTESYTLQFWSKLRQDVGLFDSLTQLNDYLVDSDLMSVRDLYKKVKEVLSQENTERIFRITDTQLLELHEQIDHKFEQMLTDNLETDEIFDRATIEKSQKRLPQQTCFDIREALNAQNLRMAQLQKSAHQATEVKSGRKRDVKKDEKHEAQVALSMRSDPKHRYRAYSLELKQFEQLAENYRTMLNLGFLNQTIVHQNLGRLLNVPQLISRPGRPVTIPVTYEDMMNVDTWDDSMLVFKKVNMQGFDMFQQQLFNATGGTAMAEEGGPGGTMQQASKGSRMFDERIIVCGICQEPGKLICCDDCPGAFHADCLGYTKACPRGKWKCYFCKVIRHGIPRNVPRMAPNEQPVCDVLAETRCPSWEVKAAYLFDILEDYFCCKCFFEPLAIDNEQLRLIRRKKFKSQEQSNLDWRPTSMTALRSRLDRKEFIAYEHLWEEIQIVLTSYIIGLPLRDILHQKAQVTMNLLHTLVISYQIFELVTAKKLQLPSRAEQQAAQGDKPTAVVGGLIDKEEAGEKS